MPLVVRRRESLTEAAETAILLGEAPDGLPLVLSVLRRSSVRGAVMAALGKPSRADLAPEVSDALDGLEQALCREARLRGICDVGGHKVYRSKSLVGVLFGDTMLARALGAHSPLILDEDRFAPSSQPEMVANTAAMAMMPRPITAMKGLNVARRLAVPLQSGPAYLAEKAEGDDGHESLLPFRFEDLRPIPSARFTSKSSSPVTAPLADEVAYARAVREHRAIAWTLGALDLARAVAGLGRSVQGFHDDDRVHCDIKPSNALLLGNTAIAIDPIGVAVGAVSPGATPGWAAPEQILARPVSPATDVYALGLMTARLLRAAIYGEERSFIIPTGGGDRRRVRILSEQDVFIDHELSGLTNSDRLRWCDFIRRCVAFAPEDRPQSGRAFADELDQLLDDSPLVGDVGLVGGPGELRRNTDLLGAFQPSWVVTDFR